MNKFLEQLRLTRVEWQMTPNSPYIFWAVLEEKVVQLRLNDFPDEPLCTVILDGAETDLHEFSKL